MKAGSTSKAISQWQTTERNARRARQANPRSPEQLGESMRTNASNAQRAAADADMEAFTNQTSTLPAIQEETFLEPEGPHAPELSGASREEILERRLESGARTQASSASHRSPSVDSTAQQQDPLAIAPQYLTAQDSYEADAQRFATDQHDPHRRNDAVSVASSRLSQLMRHMQHRAMHAMQLQTAPPPSIPPSIGADQRALTPTAQDDAVYESDDNDDASGARSPSVISRASADIDENEQQENMSEISEVEADQDTASQRSGISRVAEQIEALQLEEAHTEGAGPETQADATEATPESGMLLEPETRPISLEQLINEVKGIYAGLVMVEKKCDEMVAQQMQIIKDARAANQPIPQLSNQQWQALTALHRTLLHEHHDFFLASFHSMGTKALRKLHKKRDMPARMWRHGIHNYLELLRMHIDQPNGQPNGQEHARAFIALVQGHLGLLKESVPGDKNLPESEQVAPDLDLTWIECLGDVARYRMAISVESDERSHWNRVATRHYQEVVARTPADGRLFHHLSILANDPVERLGLLGKSMSAVKPFTNARNTHLDVELGRQQGFGLPLSATLARLQGALLAGSSLNPEDITTFFQELRQTIEEESPHFRAQGPHLASALLAGVVGFGAEDSEILRGLVAPNEDGSSRLASPLATPEGGRPPLEAARDLAFAALENAVDFFNDPTRGDSNLLPFVHVFMNFLHGTMPLPAGQTAVSNLSWNNIALMLNRLADQHREIANNTLAPSVEATTPVDERAGGWRWSEAEGRLIKANSSLTAIAPGREELAEEASSLPEDVAMLGAAWNAHPDSAAFTQARQQLANPHAMPEQEPSQAQDQTRRERILTLAVQLAEICPWLEFDPQTSRFRFQETKGKGALREG